jgi:uncharacterized membrane protein YqjE
MADRNGDDKRDKPVGELMGELARETTTLMRQELELAKAEMREKGKEAGVGAGMLGGGAVAALLALGSLTAFAILVLSTFLPDWAAALVVAIVWGVAAAVLAMRGKERVQEAGAPVPEEAMDSMKEDVQWAKTRMQSGRT